MSETETLARDVRAFEAFAREQCRRRMELTALACVFISSFAWVIGRVVLAGDPLDAPGRFWLAVLAVVSVVAWLVFRYLPLARRHPTVFAFSFHGALTTIGALHVGERSDLNGPFFYIVYILPPLPIALPLRLPARVTMTLLGPAAFGTAYFARFPQYAEHPMIHVPIVVLIAIIPVSILMGHAVYKLVRERFFFARRLERQQAQLEAHAARLQREVEERTEAVQHLASELESQTVDREDVARALHDDLGQLIVGVRMELDTLERTLRGLATRDGPPLGHLSTVVETLDRSVRGFISRLREPPTVDDLEESLEELVAPLRARSGVAIETEVRLDGAVPSDATREAMYRLVQEALSNAFKHAEPTRIRIALRRAGEALLAEVEDDGRGFDVEASRVGLGLKGLRERARALGGVLELLSGEGGTTVRMRLPAAATMEVRA